MSVKALRIYVDAATKGNPGRSGIGLVVCDENDKVLKNLTEYIGATTNNIAEYTGIIYALQEALIMGAVKVTVLSDSELVVKQVNREYVARDEDLKRLRKLIDHLSKGFQDMKLLFIKREENRGADRLANQALEDSS